MEYPLSGIGCTPMSGSCNTESELQRIANQLNTVLHRIECASQALTTSANRIKREKIESGLVDDSIKEPHSDDFCSAAWQVLIKIESQINNIERVNRHLESVV